MLKISEGKPGNAVTLRLEGRIVGLWVSELRQICEPLVSDGSRVTLDLEDVTFADESGVALLLSLKKRGTKLINATPFIEEQMKVLASEAQG